MFIEMQIGNQLDEDDYLHFDYQSIIIMKKKVFVSDCYDLLHSGLLSRTIRSIMMVSSRAQDYYRYLCSRSRASIIMTITFWPEKR